MVNFLLEKIFPFLNKEQKALDLLKVCENLEDNVSSQRMSTGVKRQYQRFNDPSFAAKELRERLMSREK